MKKFLFVAVACILSSAAFAQKVMTIQKNDGSVVVINTNEVKEITFGEPESTPIYVGEWKVKSFEYTPEEMYDYWGGMIPSFTGWPIFNAEDRITITEDKMITNLTSELKNYFQPESNLKPIDEYVLPGMVKRSLTMVELDNVNRNFSATETSEDKVALLGFFPNEDDEDCVDVYIIDHNSKSFGYPDFEEWEMYGETKPTATMSGVHVKFTMERMK